MKDKKNEADNVINQALSETKKEKKKDEKRLTTGIYLRDIILGGGDGILGVKTGIIWNMIGVSGAGKTFEGNELIYANKKKYGDKFKFNYDATSEGGNDINCENIYGFPVVTEDSLRSFTVEKLMFNIKKFIELLEKDELGVYIVDSLDGLISQEIEERIENRKKAHESDKNFDEGSYLMARAKFLKQEFFPHIKPLIEKSNCLLIIISQQSEKVGVSFGSKKDRAGGKALKFFAHIESWCREVEKITITAKKETIPIGIRNKVEFTKTRNDRPFRSHYNTIFFDFGIADVDNNVDYLFSLLTESGKDKAKKDQKIEYDGKEFKTKEALINYIEENDLENDIKMKVLEKWEEVEKAAKQKVKRKKKV